MEEPLDWPQIAALYGELVGLTGSAVVELNRAIAVAEAEEERRGSTSSTGSTSTVTSTSTRPVPTCSAASADQTRHGPSMNAPSSSPTPSPSAASSAGASQKSAHSRPHRGLPLGACPLACLPFVEMTKAREKGEDHGDTKNDRRRGRDRAGRSSRRRCPEGRGSQRCRDLALERRGHRHRRGPCAGAGRRAVDHRRCEQCSPEQAAATEFFTAAARNLQEAGARAGVERIVVVSIIGIDRFTGGYGAAKLVHEQAMLSGPIPAQICGLRSSTSWSRSSPTGDETER